MRFYEYEAKQVFRRHNIPLGRSDLAHSPADARRIAGDIGGPVVLKSQVLSGGRMKAGAVKFADTPEQAEELYNEIFKVVVNDQKARSLLVEEKCAIETQYYIGVTWDGRKKCPVLIFTDHGGIDVEEVAEKHPERISKTHLPNLMRVSPYRIKQAIGDVGVKGSDINQLVPIVATLVSIFFRYDLTLCEINPLAKLEDGRFICLDGHIDLEAEARSRQSELLQELGITSTETRQAREPTPFEIRGAEVNATDHRGVAGNVVEFDGDLGLVIGAGGGSLTLFDAIRNQGGEPANYCEIGGNPSVKKTCELTKLILSKPGVRKVAVLMNVVSNTRVDIVARGVIKGCIEMGRDPAETIAVFRIPGAWEQEGVKILEKYHVQYCDRSVSMYEAAGRAVARMAED